MEITTIERSRLGDLESTIERGQQTFIEVGLALAEIRDSELYKESFSTFEDYCKERWGWERAHAYRLIGASEAIAQMSPVGDTPQVQNERQARELAKIKDPVVRAQVWQQVNQVAAQVETAVTAKLIQQAVNVHVGNGISQEAIQQINNARAEHLEQVKNSPATRWVNFLYEIQVNINSIRDNGGIGRLASRWSVSQKQEYLRSLHSLRNSINTIAEQLEGAIDYDSN